MNAMTKTLAPLVAAVVFAMASPSAARAGEAHHTGYLALGLASLFLAGATHAHAPGHHHGKAYYGPGRHRHGPPFAAHDRRRGRFGDGFGPRRGPCHVVYRLVYDAFGRPLKIAGTMCYDAYGRAYMVRGSRYLVRRW